MKNKGTAPKKKETNCQRYTMKELGMAIERMKSWAHWGGEGQAFDASENQDDETKNLVDNKILSAWAFLESTGNTCACAYTHSRISTTAHGYIIPQSS